MGNSSCTTTDGSVMCGLPDANGVSACGCSQPTAKNFSPITIVETLRADPTESKRDVQSIVAFAIGCVTSPCCTLLYVPLVLLVFAGTPIAVWLGANLGWVYGALTLLSVLSFGLALWWRAKKPIFAERKIHVEQ